MESVLKIGYSSQDSPPKDRRRDMLSFEILNPNERFSKTILANILANAGCGGNESGVLVNSSRVTSRHDLSPSPTSNCQFLHVVHRVRLGRPRACGREEGRVCVRTALRSERPELHSLGYLHGRKNVSCISGRGHGWMRAAC